jgi:hypothetical protein
MSDQITSQSSNDSMETTKRKLMSKFVKILKVLIRIVFYQCANRKLN